MGASYRQLEKVKLHGRVLLWLLQLSTDHPDLIIQKCKLTFFLQQVLYMIVRRNSFILTSAKKKIDAMN